MGRWVEWIGRREWVTWLGFGLVAAGAPFVLDDLALFTASRIVILALWASSLNLLLGQTGLVSFAHAAFFGAGAYSVGLVWLHLGWPALVGLPLSIVAGAVLAFVTGLVALRAAHLYFSMLTLAISQLMFAIVFAWYDVTLGDNGIHGIELPAFLDTTRNAYWLVVAIAAAGLAVLRIVFRSPFGAALQAIRDNRLRAAFIGLHVRRYELAAFTIAGALAGLAGSLFAVFNRSAYPALLDWTSGATPILVILLGGMYRFWGPFLGAAVFVLLEESVTRETLYSNLVVGSIFLLIVLLAPGGLATLVTNAADRLRASGRSGPVGEPLIARRSPTEREP